MPRPSARNKLMEAAMSSFQVHGFKGCTIEDIAAGAGVFKGSFYNHFASKEALAIAAVKLYLAEGFETLAPEGPPSPRARLRSHFEALAAAGAEHRKGCLLANFSAEVTEANPGLRAALNEGMAEWYAKLAEVIRQGQGTGEIDARQEPEQLARFIVNAWEGATIRLKMTGDPQSFADFFAVVFEGILGLEHR